MVDPLASASAGANASARDCPGASDIILRDLGKPDSYRTTITVTS